MLDRTRPLALTLTLTAMLAVTTACVPLPSPLGPEGAATVAPEAPLPGDERTGVPAEEDLGDPLAERDRFFEEQGLPLDGSPLSAVTPAQKEFIAQQQAYAREMGREWTDQDESFSLALVADACETAILSSHDVDGTTLQAHVATSPLFAQLVPADVQGAQRTQAEAGIASLMVFGTTFLCPEDGDAWIAAYEEVYGG